MGHLAWPDRLGSSKGWPLSRLLLECRLLLRLLLEELLLLLWGKLLLLLRNELLLLLRQEVSRQGINLTILVIVTRESLQSNLFPCKLGQGDLLRPLLRSKLLLLLGSKLLLLRSKLLLLRGKLLLLLSRLPLLLLPRPVICEKEAVSLGCRDEKEEVSDPIVLLPFFELL